MSINHPLDFTWLCIQESGDPVYFNGVVIKSWPAGMIHDRIRKGFVAPSIGMFGWCQQTVRYSEAGSSQGEGKLIGVRSSAKRKFRIF